MIDVKTKDENGVAIIEVAGEVDMYSSPEVRSAIISLTKAKDKLFVLIYIKFHIWIAQD